MKDVCHDLRASIDLLLAGELERLNAEVVERVEAHLNECEACAGRVSAMAAIPHELETRTVKGPTPKVWERTWEGIESASRDNAARLRTASPSAATRKAAPRLMTPIRMWSGMAAAAVLMISVGLWQMATTAGGATSPLDLARSGEVRIDGMQVFGSATSFVLAAGEDENIPVIWVVEDDGT